MKKYVLLFVFCGLASGLGCDNNNPNDGPNDVDRLVGLWTFTSLADDTGDLTPVLEQAFHSITFTFTADMQFTWTQDGVDDADDDVIQGTYSVAEADGELRITLTDDSGFSVPLTFDYSFENDTTLNLTIGASQFNEAAESDFMGTIRVTLLRS